MSDGDLDFETLAAHAGVRAPVGNAIATVAPISASTTFTAGSIDDVHAALGPDGSGFAYSRNANPTVATLETVLAALEGAEDVVAFGSGMAAISSAVLALELAAGDTIVAASALYGVTRALFSQLEGFGLHTIYVDVFDSAAVQSALESPGVRALYFESISNPLLQVPDVGALTEMAHRQRAAVIVDNTFATPCLFRPLDHGVDVVVHSATKYIAGHGDVTAGVAAGSKTWGQRIRSRRTTSGGILSPFEAWLTLRGVRTLPLRMERQCLTAREVAEWLARQPWTEKVYYPGLRDSPHRSVAARQFDGRFGAMIACDLRATQRQALAFIDALGLIIPGTSLGDAVSLILYPRLSSHRSLEPDQLQTAGIGEGLVRLSVGLESSRDLVDDLSQAARSAQLESTAMFAEH